SLILGKVVFALLAFCLFFGLWELFSYLYQEQRIILPAPSAILMRIADNPLRFMHHSYVTFLEMMGGFVLAFSAAFPLGLLMHVKHHARLILQPFFVFIQCIPMFALAPIMVIWFGWSYTAIVIPTALMIFFHLTITIYQGLKAAPQELIDYFKINQATAWQIFYKLKLPFSFPHIFSGFKVAAAAAGIGAIAGEFAGASSGLGILMLESRRATDLETTFAALFCLSFMSISLYLLILAAEKMTLRKGTFTACLAFFLLLLSGCAKNEPPKTRLLLDWLPNPNHVALYAGLEKGIFKKHGIDLEIQKIPDPSDVIPYVIAGRAEIALFYMPDTLRAIQAGHSLKPIGILFKQPLNAFIFRKGEGINLPFDLNGKTIGYSVDGSSTTVLDYILRKNSIVPKEKQNVTFDLVSTLCLKHVDAIYGAYWNIECAHINSLGQETDHFDLLSLGYPNYYELIAVVASHSKEASLEFEKTFQIALQESIDYSKACWQEAFSFYAAHNPDKSAKTLSWEKASWEKTYPLLAKDQFFDPEVTQTLCSWLIDNKLIE
ncbi:MAG TPA: ABC transporter substrate-binding protein, partial [Parachlamydiaceae bacterium]|nr:ABC transporter substrate-binding protein [Parachlamydiaceae bacterium]